MFCIMLQRHKDQDNWSTPASQSVCCHRSLTTSPNLSVLPDSPPRVLPHSNSRKIMGSLLLVLAHQNNSAWSDEPSSDKKWHCRYQLGWLWLLLNCRFFGFGFLWLFSSCESKATVLTPIKHPLCKVPTSSSPCRALLKGEVQ